jgi:hypothetical protein
MQNVSPQLNDYESYTLVSGVDQAEMYGSLECTHRVSNIRHWHLSAMMILCKKKMIAVVYCARKLQSDFTSEMPVSYLQDELLLLSM